MITLAEWASERGEIPRPWDWINDAQPETADPMGHMI